jgi:hypothetical protein
VSGLTFAHRDADEKKFPVLRRRAAPEISWCSGVSAECRHPKKEVQRLSFEVSAGGIFVCSHSIAPQKLQQESTSPTIHQFGIPARRARIAPTPDSRMIATA